MRSDIDGTWHTLTFDAAGADDGSMPSLLSLEYPNGRTAEVTVARDVRPGEEFELFGRRWKAVARAGRTARYRSMDKRRLLCRPVGG